MENWRDELNSFFGDRRTPQPKQDGMDMAKFISATVLPAFAQIREELEKHDRQVTIRDANTSCALIVTKGGEEEITYRIQGRTFPNGVLPYAEIRARERKGLRLVKVEVMFRSGPQDYAMEDITPEEVIKHFLTNYTRRVRPE